MGATSGPLHDGMLRDCMQLHQSTTESAVQLGWGHTGADSRRPRRLMQSIPLVQLQREHTHDAGAHHDRGEHMCASSADCGMTACMHSQLKTTVVALQLGWGHPRCVVRGALQSKC